MLHLVSDGGCKNNQPIAPPSIPVIDTIDPVVGAAKAWLVDIWGVMHNGANPFGEAVDVCRSFRGRGGLVLLLSNSPRPAEGVYRQLNDIGVSSDAWDAIVTSGDATRKLIQMWGDRPVFHLGPERDVGLFEGLPARRVSRDDALGVVCSGLFDDTAETPDDYRELLSQFARRELPMICANPDLKVERAGQIIYCAGALAEAYEQMGGQVAYGGKPYRPIYDMALERLSEIHGSLIKEKDVVAIGDGVQTDIKGAAGFGIRSVYIASRVHLRPGEALSSEVLEQLFSGADCRPIAGMTALK